MHKTFLNYIGKYQKIDENNFKFTFIEGINEVEEIMRPLFIVPPILDAAFKMIFSYDKKGMENAKNCLNSILFPASKSILDVTEYKPKEILSQSDIKNNKGTKIADDVFIAKFKNKKNDIVLDFEMETKYYDGLTEKLFYYGAGLRRANNYTETWVIALYIDRSKNPLIDKGASSHMVKKYNIKDIETGQNMEISLN